MRAWDRAFRRASFRGARFWVEEDGPEKGRRVGVHQISGGEAIVTQDMGRRALEVRVSAYVASDLADVEGLALEAACDAPEASMLVLPMDPGQRMHCTGCRRNRNKDRNGYIAYDLSFVVSGTMGMAGMSGLGAIRSVFAGTPLGQVAGTVGAVAGAAGNIAGMAGSLGSFAGGNVPGAIAGVSSVANALAGAFR
ncbi:DNA circularization N-terminal domain-containing protein [Aquabacter sp. CN5-332]|uniref:DNA circularization N-terminal domain-containing protein n=1 Tax=Aquabacter sp. CN5-332 TaxID=3156608 RepID=UPI0032B4F8AC